MSVFVASHYNWNSRQVFDEREIEEIIKLLENQPTPNRGIINRLKAAVGDNPLRR